MNDCLYRGPDTVNSLVGVLIRFRTSEVGYIADIEKMFHSFHAAPEHRRAMSFFWWEGKSPGNKITVYRANVQVFDNFLNRAIAKYALRHTTFVEKATCYPLASTYTNKNFYVDDGLDSATSSKETIRTLTEARSILASFNIRLHKNVSNCREVLDDFLP